MMGGRENGKESGERVWDFQEELTAQNNWS